MDTDLLLYWIKRQEIYGIMKEIDDMFHFLGYPFEHFCYDKKRYSLLFYGCFKVEVNIVINLNRGEFHVPKETKKLLIVYDHMRFGLHLPLTAIFPIWQYIYINLISQGFLSLSKHWTISQIEKFFFSKVFLAFALCLVNSPCSR